MRTLLFDIDGTLLLTNRSGSMALELAIQEEFGIPSPNLDISFGGRTDRSLFAQLLVLNDLPDNDEFRGRLRRKYAHVFPVVLRQRGGKVLPGVLPLLDRLTEEANIRSFVMTGNLTETGEQKLRHFDLLKYFDWVSGGENDSDRRDLARRTVDTIATKYEGQASDLVVIGDTISDIRCGHAVGARVVAVATGSNSREQLEAEQPFAILDDLSNTAKTLDLLLP